MIPGAQCCLELTPEAARDAIRARLGQLPRRLGPFAELALAGLCALPDWPEPGCALILGTASGPRAETCQVLDDLSAGIPVMPFGFIQSQIGVSLAALSAQCPGLARASAVFACDGFWPEAEAIACGWLAQGMPAVYAGFVEARGEAAGLSAWSCWRTKDC